MWLGGENIGNLLVFSILTQKEGFDQSTLALLFLSSPISGLLLMFRYSIV
jgi:hypothetical protein